MPATAKYTPDEIGNRGEAIYDQNIRQIVEDDNIGKLIMIDIETGQWVMGVDQITMARELRQANPNGTRYCLRIGYPAVESFAGGLRLTSQINESEVARNQAGPLPSL